MTMAFRALSDPAAALAVGLQHHSSPLSRLQRQTASERSVELHRRIENRKGICRLVGGGRDLRSTKVEIAKKHKVHVADFGADFVRLLVQIQSQIQGKRRALATVRGC